MTKTLLNACVEKILKENIEFLHENIPNDLKEKLLIEKNLSPKQLFDIGVGNRDIALIILASDNLSNQLDNYKIGNNSTTPFSEIHFNDAYGNYLYDLVSADVETVKYALSNSSLMERFSKVEKENLKNLINPSREVGFFRYNDF